jgi:2-pyrone-4,6-dicarboxylate lactonase
MAQPSPSYKAQPRKPRLMLPPGACDTHFHVWAPQADFPLAPGRAYTPTEAERKRLLVDSPQRLYGFAA